MLIIALLVLATLAIAVPVSFVWGLVASGIGYGVTAAVQRSGSGGSNVGNG